MIRFFHVFCALTLAACFCGCSSRMTSAGSPSFPPLPVEPAVSDAAGMIQPGIVTPPAPRAVTVFWSLPPSNALPPNVVFTVYESTNLPRFSPFLVTTNFSFTQSKLLAREFFRVRASNTVSGAVSAWANDR